MRTQRIHRDTFHFIVLFLLMATSFFSFTKNSGDAAKQMQTIVVTGVTYTVWGVFHHYADHDLNWKIVVEYIGLSLLGIALLWALLLQVY